MTKILIVDDQPQLRRLLRETLADFDCDLAEAADAEAAWKSAVRRPPDIVLLDIMLPGHEDGLQLCARLKADPRTAHAKVVLVSARGHRNDMRIGLDAGADDYLLKPFSPLRLLAVVQKLAADLQTAP